MNGLIAGSRGSNLALTQTRYMIARLQTTTPALPLELKIIKTTGDHIQDTPLAKIGGKGVFTKELEQSLLNREIDFAVHSLKDLPVELPAGLKIAAYLQRERPNDALISREQRSLQEIPPNGVIATGSLRRKFQLLRCRRDLRIVDVRGNIETRIKKLHDNQWDGLIVAYAALQRLGKADLLTEILSEEVLYPAVGQGIIAVECRAEPHLDALFAAINDPATATCAIAERAFLEGLGGGCQVPVGVISHIRDGRLHLAGRYLPDDGQDCLEADITTSTETPATAGKQLAEKILKMRDEPQRRKDAKK